MTKYVNQDGLIMNSEADVRRQYPDMSIPKVFDFSSLGWTEVVEGTAPEPLPWHKVSKGGIVDGARVYSQDPMDANEITELVKVKAQWLLDTGARAHGYDSIISACSYTGSSNATFAGEGQAFSDWRDQMWTWAITKLEAVSTGAEVLPAAMELLVSDMPELSLPAA